MAFYFYPSIVLQHFPSRVVLLENWVLSKGYFFDGAGYRLIFKGRVTANAVWWH